MKLLFKNDIVSSLQKAHIIDNMRFYVEQKVREGLTFSNEATLALSIFPKSEIKTFFGIVNNEIKKGVDSNALFIKYKFAGYSTAEFHPSRYYNLEEYEGQELIEKTAEQEEKKDWICYYISYRELEKIGWTDPNQVPNFVTEVFEKLDCMPDEII